MVARFSRPSRRARHLATTRSQRFGLARGGLCWRLVRAGPAALLRARGVPVRRVVGWELELLARLKVVEEAVELLRSPLPEEAADVIEALQAWAAAAGYGWGEILQLAREKRRRSGGFEGSLAALLPCRLVLGLVLGLPGLEGTA